LHLIVVVLRFSIFFYLGSRKMAESPKGATAGEKEKVGASD
jgi:hypothetical protein